MDHKNIIKLLRYYGLAGVLGFEPKMTESESVALPLGDTPLEILAGVAGFEPTNAGIKIRCLTAWRHPKNNVSLFVSIAQ